MQKNNVCKLKVTRSDFESHSAGVCLFPVNDDYRVMLAIGNFYRRIVNERAISIWPCDHVRCANRIVVYRDRINEGRAICTYRLSKSERSRDQHVRIDDIRAIHDYSQKRVGKWNGNGFVDLIVLSRNRLFLQRQPNPDITSTHAAGL